MVGALEMGLFSGGKSPAAGAAKRSGETLVLVMDDRVLYETDAASLSSRPVVVGRSRECDWCTSGVDSTLSSRHAEIVRRRGSVWIRDLGSRNGIFFKGSRVKEHRFAVGDSVLLGSCKVALERDRTAAAAAGLSAHRLEQVSGPEAGRVLELTGGADVVVGSDPGSDVFVADTLVSRRHAKLTIKKDGSCWISDLGSRNGTTVGGVPLAKDKERMLRDGDVVSVADVEFRFLDKGAVHVRAEIGRKLLVVASTVVAGVVAYSVWGSFRPDAGVFLDRAQREAALWTPDSAPERFAAAFAVLDRAAVARKADVRRSDWNELKNRMEAWTNTISCWQDIRGKLSTGGWVSAQKRFHDLSSWSWNATDASEAHRTSDAVQELVNAFLAGRSDLRKRDWDAGREVESFRADSRRFAAALRAVPSTNACPWLAPLVGEAAELKAEFDATLSCLAEIPGSLAPLARGVSFPPRAAAEARVSLESLLARDRAHALERAGEITNSLLRFRSNPSYPFHAPVVAARIGEVLEPLKALAAAERQFSANVDAIASGRWRALRTELDLPPRELTDKHAAFMVYRARLEEANAALCGPVAGEIRSRLDALENAGFGQFVAKRAAALDRLFDPAALSAALRFVDASTPLPSGVSSKPVCAYDDFAGFEETSAFLDDLSFGSSPASAASQYDAAWESGGKPWTSAVRDARRVLVPLRSFLSVAKSGASPLVAHVFAASPNGGNRCAEAMRAARSIVDSVSDWCEEDLAVACTAAGGERSAVFREAVTLLLMDTAGLSSSSGERRAAALGEKWKSLKDRLRKIERVEGQIDPDGARRKIVATGLPFNGPPFKGAWRKLREAYGQGGGR